MSNTFEFSDKFGFVPLTDFNSFSEEEVILSSLETSKKIRLKNTLVFRKDRNDALANSIIPTNKNEQRVFVKRTEKEILKNSGVSKISETGLSYWDIKPIYNITLGKNLVEAIERNPNNIEVLEKSLMSFLEINSPKEREKVSSTIRNLIHNHVTKNPSSSYRVPNGFEKLSRLFSLCIELSVIDINNLSRDLAQGLFHELAHQIRKLKLGEEKWNPNVATKKYFEGTSEKAKYTPLLFDLSKLKLSATKELESLPIRTKIEETFQGFPDIPTFGKIIPELHEIIEDLTNHFLEQTIEKTAGFVSDMDHIVKLYNAYLVGFINGVIELIASIIDLLGFLIGALFHYDTQQALLDAITTLWDKISWELIGEFISTQLKELFGFLTGKDSYKNAYDFGVAIPALIELIIDAIYAVKGAGKIITTIKEAIERTNRLLKNLEIFDLLNIDRKTLKALEEKGINIEIEPIFYGDTLYSGVPIKIPDTKRIHIKHKGQIIRSFDDEKEANKFLKALKKDLNDALREALDLNVKTLTKQHHTFLKKEKLTIERKGKSTTNIELINNENITIRFGTPDDIDEFIDLLHRNDIENIVLTGNKNLKQDLSKSHLQYDSAKTPHIKPSKNGTSPNFPLESYRVNGKFGNGKIPKGYEADITEMERLIGKFKGQIKTHVTGDHVTDFSNCWKVLGVKDEKTIRRYNNALKKLNITIHHLDDLDTNFKSTFQFVDATLHKNTYKHMGSNAQHKAALREYRKRKQLENNLK